MVFSRGCQNPRIEALPVAVLIILVAPKACYMFDIIYILAVNLGRVGFLARLPRVLMPPGFV